MSAIGISHGRRTIQIVLVDIAKGSAFAGCYQLPAQIVGGSDHAGGDVFLVVLVDIEYSLAAFRLLNAVAVAVIDKGGSANDRQRTVLDIPGDGLRAAGGDLDI